MWNRRRTFIVAAVWGSRGVEGHQPISRSWAYRGGAPTQPQKSMAILWMPLDSRTIKSLCPRWRKRHISPRMCPSWIQIPRSWREIGLKKLIFHSYWMGILILAWINEYFFIPQFDGEDWFRVWLQYNLYITLHVRSSRYSEMKECTSQCYTLDWHRYR